MLDTICLPTIFLPCLCCPSAHLPSIFQLPASVCTERLATQSRASISFWMLLFPDRGFSLLSCKAGRCHLSYQVCSRQRVLSVGGTLPTLLLFSRPGEDNRTSTEASCPWSVGGWTFSCPLSSGTKNLALSILFGYLLGSFRDREVSAGYGGEKAHRANTSQAHASCPGKT